MDDGRILGVKELDGFHDLAHPLDCLLCRQRTSLSDDVFQTVTCDVVHHKILPSVGDEEVLNAGQVGVLQSRQYVRFGIKLLLAFGRHVQIFLDGNF